MQTSLEISAIVLFGVIGLSHVVQPRAWAEYFIFIRGKRETGAFIDGFLHLPFAALIIGFHNVWSGYRRSLRSWVGRISSRAFCASACRLRDYG